MDEKTALKILQKYAPDDRTYRIVLKHSRAVQKYAVWLARRISKYHSVDVDFVATASLLHDIGRYWHPPGKLSYKHGVKGASVLRKEKLPERYAHVCERHLGAGITKTDIIKQKLKLPLKDYLPRTIEEKIVCYADKRIEGYKLVPILQVVRRYDNELGSLYAARLLRLDGEIQKLYKPWKTVIRHRV